MLEVVEIAELLARIRLFYEVDEKAEITVEANPDDISIEKLRGWKLSGINRLSIGVQSFFQEDLEWMNRAHNATQAMEGLRLARELFENITIDLIYGTPLLTDERWKRNVDMAIALGIPHISCYALTVELKTPLQKMIQQGKKEDVNPDNQSGQFLMLMNWLKHAGYEHYEISNFAKPGFRSRHNSSYWEGKKYLGLGPSAHSFDGISREWNVANNQRYIQSIMEGSIPSEKEILTDKQKQNEYVMIALRTSQGMTLNRIDDRWKKEIGKRLDDYAGKGLMVQEGEFFRLTEKGKLLADGIASDLFVI